MTPPSPAADLPPRVPLALLVLIAFTGTLAMHIFVPALPGAAGSLATDSRTIQLAISLYILGLALGQLLYGPAAERFGRRPAVLAGLAIYFGGTLACLVAPNIEVLLFARLVQALGGAGGLALTRVIVADTHRGASATRGIAALNLILLVGPGLAPVFGASLSEWFGWRSIFVFLSLLALTAFALTIARLPETRPAGDRTGQRGDASGFATLLRSRRFLQSALGGAAGSTACYAYFVSAPFILHSEMGVSVQVVGWCVGATLAAAAIGTLLTRSLVGRVRERALQLGFAGLGVAGGALLLSGAVLHLLTPVSVVVLSLVVLFAAGGLGPVSIGTALRDAAQHAGTGSGLYGFFQMGVGVVCSGLAGLFADHALGCGLIILAAYAFCWTAFYRRREPVA